MLHATAPRIFPLKARMCIACACAWPMLDLLCSGPQALAHLEAIRAVRSITRVHVWGRKPARAAAVASAVAAASGLPVRVCESAQEAVAEADIVCTLTSAQAAVLEGAWLKPGAHVRATLLEGGEIGGDWGSVGSGHGPGWSGVVLGSGLGLAAAAAERAVPRRPRR